MAGIIAHVSSGEVALVAATAKTVLQIKAAANQRALLRSLRITGKQAAGGTDTPLFCRLTRSTANFGTGTPVTPAKNDPTDDETIQTSAARNFSSEPTSPTDALIAWEIQPQSGIIEFLPPGLEIKIPGGQSLNIEMTSSGTPTVLVSAAFEE